jgi:hypothetical protein
VIEPPAANSHPAQDEESFTRLLAAAYVMQEHQDRVRAQASPADLAEVISQIVETQNEIRSGSLNRDQAFDLIAKRLCSMSGAAGVAIATVEGESLRYRAGTGSAARIVRSQVAKQASLAWSCLKTGTTFQSPLALTDPRLDAARCRELDAQSLLAVPLYQNGQVAGAIEMYFSQVSGFGESKTRGAELMSDVASEVLADAAERGMKQELESERASVLEALEMLEPEFEKIAIPAVEPRASSAKPEAEVCRACGHPFLGTEIACGVCGASRTTGGYLGAAFESKWAVLWERHLSGREQGDMPWFRKEPPKERARPIEKLPADFVSETDISDETRELDSQASASLHDPVPREETDSAIVLSPANPAAEARNWLSLDRPEKVWTRPLRLFWTRPGDASLILATLVLLTTLIWAFWPSNASLATAEVPAVASGKGRPRPRPPKLTLFEEVLVGLGLAVPPPTPEYMGDPNLKVWEDLQTGLYYCPGADLYGTTAKGGYRTQAEAQQDAYEPAFHKPCD